VRIIYLATVDSSIRYLLLDQLRYLRLRGHDVHAICAPGPNVPVIERAGITVHAVDLTRRITPLKDLRALWSIVRILSSLHPDLVHTNTPKASLLGQYAALAARVPHRVHTIHGLYLPADAKGPRRRAFLALERVTMWPAHAVLSVSAEDVTTCERYQLCPRERLRYLGQGIDIERFVPPRPEERQRARAALAIPENHDVVGMVGRLVREKGVVEFFAAAREVLKRWPNTTFIVIGETDTAKADALTEADLRRVEPSPQIRFLGHRDDLPMLYWAMDLLLHPSYREGFPRVPLEASACGVAVVATDVRGCREAVQAGVNGLLVPARDADALAEAAGRLLADDEARTALGRGGREMAIKSFDQRAVFARVAETYAELSAGLGGRATA
jgi:glycosyltransferase involved in cell wall biosynthesis